MWGCLQLWLPSSLYHAYHPLHDLTWHKCTFVLLQGHLCQARSDYLRTQLSPLIMNNGCPTLSFTACLGLGLWRGLHPASNQICVYMCFANNIMEGHGLLSFTHFNKSLLLVHIPNLGSPFQIILPTKYRRLRCVKAHFLQKLLELQPWRFLHLLFNDPT